MDFDFTLDPSKDPAVQLRKRLVALYQVEGEACTGGNEVRIGYPTPSGGMDWLWVNPSVADGKHSYRTVQPNEIVFDIGDKTHWVETVADATAIMAVLNDAGVRYWCALSGGDGIHIHLWGPPRDPNEGFCVNCSHDQNLHIPLGCAADGSDGLRCNCIEHKAFHGDEDDWRIASARIILTLAGMRKWGSEWGAKSIVDPVLVAPNLGKRQVREFACRKESGSHGPKTLWHAGPSPNPPLPYSVDEAYKQAKARGLDIPLTIPRNTSAPFGEWSEAQSFFHGPCPIRPGCLLKRCDTCPRGGDGSETKAGSTYENGSVP